MGLYKISVLGGVIGFISGIIFSGNLVDSSTAGLLLTGMSSFFYIVFYSIKMYDFDKNEFEDSDKVAFTDYVGSSIFITCVVLAQFFILAPFDERGYIGFIVLAGMVVLMVVTWFFTLFGLRDLTANSPG